MNDAAADEFDLIVEEFVAEIRQGKHPEPEVFASRYPQHAAEIRELFPTLLVMENVAPLSELETDAVARDQAIGRSVTQGPQTLGDFRIIREIGRGGMGIVYEAEQQSLGRRVALKVLSSQTVASPTQKKRFQRESRAAARLHHTNIVPVFGVGEADGTLFYIMQYIPGLALNEVLLEVIQHLNEDANEQSAFPVPKRPAENSELSATLARSLSDGSVAVKNGKANVVDASDNEVPDSVASSISLPGSKDGSEQNYVHSVARIGVQVAEALEYAHSQGVVHRDIKPANLLLDLSGTVWVADFGLASLEDQDNLTRTNDLLGTLRYMPPEALEGTADTSGDIYSLGLTLYELLAMRPAIDCRDRKQALKLVSAAQHDSLHSIDPTIPIDLQTIVHKSISRDVRDRYSSAGELAADLNRFLNDEPIVARRTSPTERLVRWWRRNPVIAGLTTTVAVLLFVVATITTSLLLVARNERELAMDAKEHAEEARATARNALSEAEKSEQLAIDALSKTEALRQSAELAAAKEAEARKGAEQSLYISKIALASSEYESGNVREAQRLLDECPKDHRGWEWRYLKRLVHSQPEQIKTPGINKHACVSFSVDGKRIALAGDPGHAVVIDRKSQKILRQFDGLQTYFPAIACHPTQPIVAMTMQSAEERNTEYFIALFNIESGEMIDRFPAIRYRTTALAFSPDGEHLGTVSQTGKSEKRQSSRRPELVVTVPVTQLSVWGLNDKQPVFQVDGASVYNDPVVRWSADSKRLVSSGASMNACLYNAETGNVLREFKDDGVINITDVRFSPDEKRVAVSDQMGQIIIFDAQTGKSDLAINVGSAKAWSIDFSPDGQLLASGNGDGTVKVWNSRTGRQKWHFRYQSDQYVVHFLDQDHLISFHQNGTRRLTDLRRGPLPLAIYADSRPAFGSNGNHIISLMQGKITRTNLNDLSTEPLSNPSSSVVRSHSVSADGSRLVAKEGNGYYVQDIETGERLFEYDQAYRAALNENGRLIAVRGWDHRVHVFDVDTGRSILEKSFGRASELRFFGKALFVYSLHQIVAIDVPTGDEICNFSVETDLADLSVDMSSKTIATVGRGSSLIETFDFQGKLLRELRGHSSTVSRVVFHPNGSRLASASWDGDVRLWDTTNGRCMARIRGHRHTIRATLAFSYDGNRLVTQDSVGLTRIWDATPSDDTMVDTLTAKAAEKVGADQIDEAIELLDEAIIIRNDDYMLYRERGNLFAATHRWEQACRDYEAAVELRGHWGDLYRLALLQLRTGNMEGYQKTTDQLLESSDRAGSTSAQASVLRACLAGPDPNGDDSRILSLANVIAQENSLSLWQHHVLAKHAYAIGNFHQWSANESKRGGEFEGVRMDLYRAMANFREDATEANATNLQNAIEALEENVRTDQESLSWVSYIDTWLWIEKARDLVAENN